MQSNDIVTKVEMDKNNLLLVSLILGQLNITLNALRTDVFFSVSSMHIYIRCIKVRLPNYSQMYLNFVVISICRCSLVKIIRICTECLAIYILEIVDWLV